MHGITISDIHGGDCFGLTDPANIPQKKHKHAKEFTKILYDWYGNKLVDIGPVQTVLCPGEVTEGRGDKDTIELWTTDLEEQAESSAEILAMIPAEKYYINYATQYHSGREMRTDRLVARLLRDDFARDAEIQGTWRLDIEKVKVNLSHHTGGSSTPHTFASQLMKSGTNDVTRAWYRGFEPADLYFRAHTHIYGYAGNDRLTVYNCPAMKWPLGHFGIRIDRPYYAMGFLEWWVEGSEWWIKPHIFRHPLPEEKYVKVA